MEPDPFAQAVPNPRAVPKFAAIQVGNWHISFILWCYAESREATSNIYPQLPQGLARVQWQLERSTMTYGYEKLAILSLASFFLGH